MSLEPHQIRTVLKSQINRSLVDFGRRDFTREELVFLASADEALLDETLSEWEGAGYLTRKRKGPFFVRVLRPVEVPIPGWTANEPKA